MSRLVGLVFLVCGLAACGPASRDAADDDDPGPPMPGTDQPICTPGVSEACYDGPVGTENIGACKGGTRTCSADGYSWSSCVGELMPAPEACTPDGVDQDCDGQVDVIADVDGDGFTRCTGDCCETTSECGEPAHVNPGAAEAPTAMGGVPVDDDCDGQIDETEASCDDGFAVDDFDPVHGASAVGLCKVATPGSPGGGLLSAKYVRASGAAAPASAQVGLLDNFGPNVPVREGKRLLALSSGHARRAADPGACGSLTCVGYGAGTAPAGFPQDVPSCAGDTAINDDVALELHLRAPTNAVGFSVDFAFYSFEYPEWVCTSFNDQFIVTVAPAPTGSINGNIAFDAQHNPVSVNVGFFDVCNGCPQGTAALAGTGFDTWNDAGATVWLRSQAPVTPGAEMTVRFVIWDTGDTSWDSTAIVDNFQWILSGSPGVDTTPVE